MTDPTKEQMMEVLEHDSKDDAEIAIYYFAANYHGGQGSNLYSVLSTSPFKPSVLSKGIESEDELIQMMYRDLEDSFN